MGGIYDRQCVEFINKEGCEICWFDVSFLYLNRRLEYDFDDWSRVFVEGQ